MLKFSPHLFTITTIHVFYINENYDEAKKYYLEVLQHDPSHINVIIQMGMSFCKQQRFSEGRAYFHSVSDKKPNEEQASVAWLNIAANYRFEKRFDDAVDALQEAKTRATDETIGDILAEEKELTTAKKANSYVSSPQRSFTHSPPENNSLSGARVNNDGSLGASLPLS